MSEANTEAIRQAAGTGALRVGDLVRYGLMAFPLAFAGLPVYLHAPDFYATSLGLSLTSLGAVLLGLRVIDAVQDPLIGALSDRLQQHRPAILCAGVLLLGSGFWMVFNPVETRALSWFALAVFLCTTGFSIVTINLQALGGLWHASEHQRTRITSWREAFGLIGLLAAAIAPPLLGSVDDPQTAFHRLTLLYLPLLGVAAVALLYWNSGAEIDRASVDATPITWKTIAASSWRRRFFAIYLLNTFASAIPAVLVLFFIRDRLGAEAQTGLFLLLYFLSGALSMAFWQRVSKRAGKLQAWALSMALSIVTFMWAALLGPGDVWPYALVCILSGTALGADLALPPSILADHIAIEKDQDAAGRYFSLMTFLSKAALALATGLTLPALGLAGYQPGMDMTPSIGLSLTVVYAVLPCVLKGITVIWLWSRLAHLERSA